MSRSTLIRKPPVRLPVAEFIEPMKALGVEVVPTGLWHCEIKYDGYRSLAVINPRSIALWSRTQKSMTADFPEIVRALGKLKCRNAVLDGEIVALDPAGRSRFQLLQGRDVAERTAPLAYFIFDLLYLDGVPLVDQTLEERRKRLQVLLRRTSSPLQLSHAFAVEPADLLQAVRKQGLEGIIAKRPGSLYEAGHRSGAWLKCKVLSGQEVVIGGFTPPQNSRQFFGAILVGYYRAGQFLYAGKVGTGFDRNGLAALHARFLKRVRRSCPFKNLPLPRKSRFGTGMTSAEMKKVTWIKPDLVAQVKFAEWTDDGLLRQPVFLGLRQDKAAREVRREAVGTG